MKAIIFQAQSQYDVLRRFSYRYAKSLNEFGIETLLYDLVLLNNPIEYLKVVEDFKPDFTLGFNPVTLLYDEGKITHYGITGVPHFVIIVDHPYYHMNRALKDPNHPLVHTIFLEKNYEYAIQNLGIKNISRKLSLSSEQVINTNFNNKLYDMVFFGSFTPPEEILKQINEQVKDTTFRNIIFDFLADIKSFITTDKTFLPQDIEIYFKAYLKNQLNALSDEQINYLSKTSYFLIDQYYRQLTREQVIVSFAQEGIGMAVFGNDGLKRLVDKYKNVKVFNPIGYQDCMNVVAQSKATLNISAMFQSFHDRVPLAYLNKSILCTNVMEDLIDNVPESANNTIFYNLHNMKEVAGVLKEIMNNKEEFNAVTESAFQMASEHFSAEKDINELINIYNEVFRK